VRDHVLAVKVSCTVCVGMAGVQCLLIKQQGAVQESCAVQEPSETPRVGCQGESQSLVLKLAIDYMVFVVFAAGVVVEFRGRCGCGGVLCCTGSSRAPCACNQGTLQCLFNCKLFLLAGLCS
jgi:hypothetical protein